ncbi:MAG: formimidoylglutamate deiminase [Gammaproteobacteria bacterium]|nr:formimidoylglutamate deiminase [Gammaproteobacteria bacterium]MDH4255029.1 formimidoylglutamate deiminase [Gammaproteobacteria bacterium]MDH5309270.1 formimidoylglutamate deiminase [Gammaproteobacteria bacterium]
MARLFADKAWLADGWRRNVRLTLEAGHIAALETGAKRAPADDAVALLVPGLVNAHSHAFQRAFAGRSEFRGPAGTDSFWTWREQMYGLAGRIEPRALAAIAHQAYTEMVASGYTSVAEFHYLYRDPSDPAVVDAMLAALVEAADASGIRLIYVPVLYERGGFGGQALSSGQARFALPFDAYVDHAERAARFLGPAHSLALGAHSLRAVTPDSLRRIAALARERALPMHVHVAEQRLEVEDCLAVTGARPVQWLLDNLDVDARWCLVHATHLDREELARLAGTGAVVCLCPSTEGNLGDGLFPLAAWLEAGGRMAIGSDSHVTIDPREELRWLEYGQRLQQEKRNVAAAPDRGTGARLYSAAVEGGAVAAGLPAGPGIATGMPADLVALDAGCAALAGHSEATLLDALLFCGQPSPIERVMVAGAWRVVDGRHATGADTLRRYAATLASLYDGPGG